MKVQASDRLSLIFQALSDPTRRKILENLQREEKSLSELAAPFEMTMAAVMKHLKVLSAAGLIEHHKNGRVRHCRFEEGPIVEATVWLSRQTKYWQNQFDVLATFLDMQAKNELNQGENHELRIKERSNSKTSGSNERNSQKNHRNAKIPRTRKSKKL